MNISHLETRTQENVFVLTVISVTVVLIGGMLYLGFSDEQLVGLYGNAGTILFKALFDSIGFAFFALAFSAFSMGSLLIRKVKNPNEILNTVEPLLSQFIVQVFIISILSCSLSVLESHGILGFQRFEHGVGGYLGHLLGGKLYDLFGILGALLTLISVLTVVLISAGTMQVANLIYYVREKSMQSAKAIDSVSKIAISKAKKSKSISLGKERLRSFYQMLVDRIQTPPVAVGGNILAPEKIFDGTDIEVDVDFVSDVSDLDGMSSQGWDDFDIQIAEEVRIDGFVDVETPNPVKKKKVSTSKRKPTVVSKFKDNANEKSHEKDQLSSNQNGEATISEVKVESEVNSPELSSELHIEVPRYTKRYTKPTIQLLGKQKKQKSLSDSDVKNLCDNLEARLESFQIKGKVIKASIGMSLTMFEFQPAPGVKLSKILSLTDDLALLLGAPSIRILAPIPGKTTVGIEVPNSNSTPLGFVDLVKPLEKSAKEMALPIALGMNVENEVIIEDLASMPHLLVSGTTGSGKSVFINGLINSLLFTKSPKELRMLMIDPKMIELNAYNSIPHLLKPVVTDIEEAKDVLVWAEKEMDRRYEKFRDIQARNIDSFNSAISDSKKENFERKSKKKIDWEWMEMPYIVVLIDELADLMITQGKLVEVPITRIAQKARAAGIHLVLATQRPSSEIVTGLIKTNFPTRVAFKVSSAIDSRTILDVSGAEKLLGRGDMLFLPNGRSIQRLQGCFLSEGEVKKVVDTIE